MRISKTARILLIVLAAVVIVSGALLCICKANVYTVQITLRGEQNVKVASYKDFIDPGATATCFGTLFHTEPTAVTVHAGQPREEDPGVWVIQYTAECRGVAATAQRVIYVEEEMAELIDIEANANEDNVPPELMLNGLETVTLYRGDHYMEPGYFAWDDCDGELTDKVEITGKVEKYFAGEYTLTYTVTDTGGNVASASRTVKVLPCDYSGAPPEEVIPGEKVIYLTFDDGPDSRTEYLLDVLDRYGVKATFFVVNTGAPDTLRRIVEDGHSIALHTYSHRYGQIYASEEAYFEDLYKIHDAVLEITGVDTTLIRFPGGSSNTISSFNGGIMSRLTQAVVEKGFQYFDWNVDSMDAGGATSAYEVYNNVVRGIAANEVSVVLQHDIHPFSVNAVENIIQWGLDNGYTFLPLQPNSPGLRHSVRN